MSSSSSQKRKGSVASGVPAKKAKTDGEKVSFRFADRKVVDDPRGDKFCSWSQMQRCVPEGRTVKDVERERPAEDGQDEVWEHYPLGIRVGTEQSGGLAPIYFPVWCKLITQEEREAMSLDVRRRTVWDPSAEEWYYCPRSHRDGVHKGETCVDLFLANLVQATPIARGGTANCQLILRPGWTEDMGVNMRCVLATTLKIQSGFEYLLDVEHADQQGPVVVQSSSDEEEESDEEVMPVSKRSKAKPVKPSSARTVTEFEDSMLSITESNCMHSSKTETMVTLAAGSLKTISASVTNNGLHLMSSKTMLRRLLDIAESQLKVQESMLESILGFAQGARETVLPTETVGAGGSGTVSDVAVLETGKGSGAGPSAGVDQDRADIENDLPEEKV